MNIKSQLVILCLIFCILLSFSAVSATDINDTQLTLSTDDSLISTDSLNNDADISNDSLILGDASADLLNDNGDEDYTHLYFNASVGSNGNGSINSPFKDFGGITNYLWDKVALHFTSGVYSLNFTYHSNYPNSLIFRDDIKLIGENRENTILNFNGGLLVQNRNNAYVLIENLTLYNTTLTSWSHNEIECRNVIFLNSTANSENYNHGGAIFTYGDLILNNCIFRNNHADDYGGAIYVENNIEINNSSFINNSANADGGAIFAYAGNVKVDGSSFINNSADGDGGAICPYVGTTEVNDSSFISNHALNEGGSIYSSNLTKVKNSKFINNSALGGGAISSSGDYINIYTSNFTSNHATSFGGAISTKYAVSGFICDESNFINNTAGVSAGALYSIYSANAFSNSNFINCSSLFGGAICDLRSNSSYFTNLKFFSNKANKGGAIYKFFATTDIVQTDFSSNSAYEGGAIYINSIDSCDLNDVSFKDNLFDDVYSVNNNDSAVSGFENDLDKLSYLNLTMLSNDCLIFEIDEENVDIGQSRYDLRDYNLVSPVQDQKIDGNCWSFASIAALESCIIKANATVYDFSEQNMKNIVASFSDYGTISYETNDGGNSWLAMGYLSSWLGPISDEKDVYSSNVLSNLYNASTHIQNILFIPRNSYEDNDAIKTALMKYGAVATSMFYDDYYLADDSVSYYCDSEYSDTNHAVTIVGWDDNYDCSKFMNGPDKNGAFIVKNSWGPDWGENGYFYVSYYDKMFTHIGDSDFGPSGSYTFILNDTNHYEKNYQHQILINNHVTIYDYESIMFKNVFTGESDELISAVSTYFYGDYDYELSIVVNGEIRHNQSGNLANGYYTIPLTKHVPIKKDDEFEVIFKFTSKDESYPEICLFLNSYQNLRLSNQVSFCRPNEDYAWSSFDNIIVPIKAFSNYGRLNTSITVEGLDDTFKINEEYDLKAIVKNQYGDLVNEGNFIFSVDGKNYSTNLVDGIANQKVMFDNPGIHKILVLFNDTQYYYSSNITRLINIDLINTSVEISLNNSDFFVGDDVKITVNVNASKGKLMLYVNGILSDTQNVTDGVAIFTLNNLAQGEYAIVVNYADNEGNYLNSSNKTSFKVSKKEITIISEDMEINYAEDKSLDITISHDNILLDDLKVKVNINGEIMEEITENGKIFIDLNKLDVNKYSVNITVNTSEYEGNKTVTVIVNKAHTNIVAEDNLILNVGDVKAIGASLNPTDAGKLTYLSSDKSVLTVDDEGNAVGVGAGNTTVIVSFGGSDNYANSENKVINVVVSKIATDIAIDEDSITLNVGDETLISPNSTPSGLNVTYKSNNTSIATVDANGKITAISRGVALITINIIGDNKYDSSEATVIVAVNTRYDLNASIFVDEIRVGEDAVINISNLIKATGIVVVSINKNNYNASIINGTAIISVSGLIENSTAIIFYSGDDKYNNFTKPVNIIVNPSIKLNLKSDKIPSYVGDNVTIGALVNSDVGNVSFYVNGVLNQTYDVKNAVLKLFDLAYGEYNITAIYDNGGNQVKSSNYVLFDVSKWDTTLMLSNSTPIVAKYGDKIVVKPIVMVNGGKKIAEGKVTFYFENGTVIKTVVLDNPTTLLIWDSNKFNYVVDTINSDELTIRDWDAGKYIIKAVYNGNDKYNPSEEVSMNISISKYDVDISSFSVSSPVYPDVAVATIETDTPGNYTVNVAGKEYMVVVNDGSTMGSVNIGVLAAGDAYKANVTFSGSKKYNGAFKESTFDVKKAVNPVNFYVSDETILPEKVTISISNAVAGEYVVSFNDSSIKNVVLTVDGDSVSCEVAVPAGSYNATLSWKNENYFDVVKEANFVVHDEIIPKENVSMDINVDEVFEGENVTITVTLPGDASGNVSVGDVTVPVVDGTAKVIVSGLSAGNVTLPVVYSGDDKYNNFTGDVRIVINPIIKLDLELDEIPFYVGDNVTIDALVNSDEGNVSFYVNGVLNQTCDVKGAVLKLYDLAYGEYNITAIYDNGGNLVKSSNCVLFNVSKWDTTLMLSNSTPIVAKYGDKIVVKPIVMVNGGKKIAEGKVTFYFENGTVIKTVVLDNPTTLLIWDSNKFNYVVDTINSDELTIRDWDAGKYIIKAVYNGNDKYNPSEEVSMNISISKYDVDISSFSVSSPVYPDVAVATIETDTPGNYTVNVAGKEYMVVVNDGSTMGSVNIGVLAAGDAYKANVTFSESKKYNNAFKETTFDVKKAVNPVTFNIGDEITLPEKVTISISNAVAGEYVVSFNSSIKDVVLTVDGDSASCDVAVPAGSYKATLSWKNENYTDVVKEANFVVYNEIIPKENVSMSVTADAITEGENALVIVKLPVDAGGRVTINGITVLVENGTASVLIPDLPVGNNEINVAYSGDDKYNTLEMNVIVTVNEIHKYDVAMNISEGENNTILVSLPKDAVGMITAYVGDKEYIAGVVNGTATITFNDLENGNYVFSITYLGDNKYDSITKKIAIVVDNYDEVISAPNVVKYYRGTERFVVNVTDNKGNPLVNKSVNIGINGMNYSRLTNAKGSASIALGLPSGKYNVTVIIDKASINSLVTILPTVNGSDVIKVFRNDTQYYATFRDSKGDYLSEGTTVRFNINGVFYDRQVKENGLARLNINLESGSYIITAMNLQTGEMSSNNITVISRLIENKDITKYYRNATQYTVKLIGGDGNPVGAGESVIFNINGVFYTRQTNESGIAKLNLNLEPGNYIITAEYKECRVSNNIHIRSVLSANDLTKVYRGSEQFIANLIDGQGNSLSGETVQFNINGVFYNRITDPNGQAKLNINLQSGRYIITSMYNGLSISNTVIVTD